MRLSGGAELSSHTVLIATGVSYRRLDAPGFEEFVGRGVYYGAGVAEAQRMRDQDVYIIGGANSAGQAAVYFSRFARSVTLLVRAQRLEKSMSRYLIDQLAVLLMREPDVVPGVALRVAADVVGVELDRLQLPREHRVVGADRTAEGRAYTGRDLGIVPVPVHRFQQQVQQPGQLQGLAVPTSDQRRWPSARKSSAGF